MTNLKDSRQLDVLQFIYKEVQEHGYPPTVREICNAVQLLRLQPFMVTYQDLRKTA